MVVPDNPKKPRPFHQTVDHFTNLNESGGLSKGGGVMEHMGLTRRGECNMINLEVVPVVDIVPVFILVLEIF